MTGMTANDSDADATARHRTAQGILPAAVEVELPSPRETSQIIDPGSHACFEPWTDPQSGVTSYLLSTQVAPQQQSFYFTNASLSSDGRWLWFYVSFPPNPVRTLGRVDLWSTECAEDAITYFPRSGFDSASPMVAPAGEEPGCFFTQGPSIYFQPAQASPDDAPNVVFTLPAHYIAKRRLNRLATHLTLNADGRYFLLDGEVGNHWFVGLAHRVSGEFQLIREFANHHNHAQFHPTIPDRFLIAHDHTYDPVTGRRLHFDLRTWLMDTADTVYRPLNPQRYCKPYVGLAHEWWLQDGRLAYVDYLHGLFFTDPDTGETEHVWQRSLCHAHADRTAKRFVADQSPYQWDEEPCTVLFYDRITGVERAIVSAMPKPPDGRDPYHIDPHPQFCADGRWIVYTTTVRGRVEVALCDVRSIRTG